jgi:hypothetical protein
MVDSWEFTKIDILDELGHGTLFKGDSVAPGKCLNDKGELLVRGVIVIILDSHLRGLIVGRWNECVEARRHA